MKRRLAIAALLLAAVSVGLLVYGSHRPSGGHADLEQNEPGTAVVCRESVWDFGTVDPTEVRELTHTFQLENVSDETITLGEVSAGCGCIVPGEHPATIPGRGTVDVPVRVATAGRPGPFGKHVEIKLQTSPPSSLWLSIRGMLDADSRFYTVPSEIDFGRVDPGESKIRSVKLCRYDGTLVNMLRVDAEHAAVRLVGNTLQEEQGVVELTFSLDAASLPPGRFMTSIVGEAEHEEYRRFEIPVRADIADPYPGLVRSIFISALAPGESVERPLLREDGPPLEIHDFRYDGPDELEVGLVTEEEHVTVQVHRTGNPVSENKLVSGELRLWLEPDAAQPATVIIRAVASD